MKALLVITAVVLVSGCSGSPSRAFKKTGMASDAIVAASIQDQARHRTIQPAQKQIELILDEMSRIAPPRSAVVDPRFVISLYSGSSFEGQKLVIYLDETGEGYFRRGEGGEVMFHSRRLASILQSIQPIDAKTAKTANERQ